MIEACTLPLDLSRLSIGHEAPPIPVAQDGALFAPRRGRKDPQPLQG